jgi:pimeloyl-ACP methyl ester carboxylesterase
MWLPASVAAQVSYGPKADSLLARLQRADYASATHLFSQELAGKLDSVQLGLIWEGLQLNYSSYQSAGDDSSFIAAKRLVYLRKLQFERLQMRMELQFNEQQQISSFKIQPLSNAGLYVAPAYDDPAQYREFSLRVTHDTIVLPGLLTLPTQCKQCPLVLLLPDLGPQDKDHSMGPTKMFRDLAVGLAAQGIATYRFDKRSLRYGPEMMADLRMLTLETELLEDAVVALHLLKKVQEIDTNRWFVLGVGLGGLAAGELAKRSPVPLAGLVVVGSSPRPFPDQIFDQYLELLAEEPETTAKRQALDRLAAQVKLAKSYKLHANHSADSLPLQLPAPYWLYFQKHDLVQAFWLTQTPVWFVRGTLDYQSQATDLALWEQRLLGRPKLSFHSFDGLNHLMMAIDDPRAAVQYKQPAHVSQEFITTLAAYLNKLR